jgi:mannose-1-phosphate guanylyltransferase / mannose-6-phosphate isomerase
MFDRYAIILCGGSGTRLWPLSRALRPKQFLPLNGDLTLLQQTAIRVCKKINPSNLLIVTNESHRFEVKGQLAEFFPESLSGVIGEPVAKNTLPALAVAVKRIYEKDPNAIIGVFASDHAIDNEDIFFDAWRVAEAAAEDGYLTLLGIKPTDPATGYGYIKPKHELQLGDLKMPVYSVDSFVEKPSIQIARQYLIDGYLWNSGMFVFRADVFMELLSEHQPVIFRYIESMDDENFQEIYHAFPSISIDCGIAEKADRVAVVPVDMGWNDLGNWESIYQRHSKDVCNNVTKGEVILTDTKNSLLWSDAGVLTVLGVDNLVVIQTPDSTLICDRSRVEDVKVIYNKVKEAYPQMTETHMTVQRPWGSYTVLEEGSAFKIKSIIVAPGQKLSLQKHLYRSEHWVVVSGTATVTNQTSSDEVNTNQTSSYEVNTNHSTYIPAGNHHRLENRTSENLILIEVQTGSYLGEDDIVRIEDSYGRV